MEKIDFFTCSKVPGFMISFSLVPSIQGLFVFVFVLAEIQFLFVRKKKKEI
jgi:hypothetical protein